MNTLNLKFTSNVEGVYTEIKETATDKNWLYCKKVRLINNWLDILKTDMETKLNSIKFNLDKHHDDTKMELLQTYVKILNAIDDGNRTLTITETIEE